MKVWPNEYNTEFVAAVTHHVWCNPLICSERSAIHGNHALFSTGFSTRVVEVDAREKGKLT
jgi:hypothetical protein